MTFHMVGLQTQNNSTEIYSSLSDQVQANTSITKQQIGNIPSLRVMSCHVEQMLLKADYKI